MYSIDNYVVARQRNILSAVTAADFTSFMHLCVSCFFIRLFILYEVAGIWFMLLNIAT